VASQLGHTSPDLSLRVYAHPEEFDQFGASCDAEPCPAKPRSAAKRERWAALAAMKLHAHLRLGRFQDIDQVIAAYDGSILFVDSQLGLLFEYLRRTGMYENALIIVTSDHGESFLERGPYISHGYTLFDEELRVPLIVRRPGASKPDRSDDLVDLTDFAALILETSGVAQSTRLSGANPLARASGAIPKRRFVHGGSAFTGGAYVRTRDWKVIAPVRPLGALGMQRPDEVVPGFEFAEQVFDLSSGPSEQVDRAGNGASLPAAVWILRQQLDKIEPPGREKMEAHGGAQGSAEGTRLPRLTSPCIESAGVARVCSRASCGGKRAPRSDTSWRVARAVTRAAG